MIFLRIISIASFLMSFNSFGRTEVSCSHRSTCVLAKEILKNNQDFSFNVIIKSTRDPHHFTPRQKEIKRLLKATKLITPSLLLQPWLKNIIRKKDKSETITLVIPQPSTKLEAVAHFWLHPNLLCSAKKSLNKSFQELWKININTAVDCSRENKILSLYKGLASKLKTKRVILTHDALSPLLSQFIPNLLILRSSHHGEAIGPQSVKKLSNFIKNNNQQPLIWIIEEQIHIPERIKSKIRSHDKIIKINTNIINNDNLNSITMLLYEELKKM